MISGGRYCGSVGRLTGCRSLASGDGHRADGGRPNLVLQCQPVSLMTANYSIPIPILPVVVLWTIDKCGLLDSVDEFAAASADRNSWRSAGTHGPYDRPCRTSLLALRIGLFHFTCTKGITREHDEVLSRFIVIQKKGTSTSHLLSYDTASISQTIPDSPLTSKASINVSLIAPHHSTSSPLHLFLALHSTHHTLLHLKQIARHQPPCTPHSLAGVNIRKPFLLSLPN